MDIGNALLTFSQLALGLAGFSAILVALSGRPDLWTPVDSFRIKNMLTFAFEAVFLSLVPFVLAFFAISESVLWRISLVVLAAATSGGTLLVLGRFSRLSRSERAVLRPSLVYGNVAILCAASLFEVVAALGIVGTAPGVFFTGLLLLLGVAVFLVVRFLFARPSA